MTKTKLLLTEEERKARRKLYLYHNYQADRIYRPELYKQYSQEGSQKVQELRLKILKHYSSEIPSCACCGETILEFLAVDHKYGNGNEHRRQHPETMKGGGRLYKWIEENNYPDLFQVLCHNCNMAITYHKTCPHKRLNQ